FGRSPFPNPKIERPVLELSNSPGSITEYGCPDCRVTMLLSFHPEIKWPAAPPASLPLRGPLPNGRSLPKRPTKRRGMSILERPLSALGLRLSCGKFGSPADEKKFDALSIDRDHV